MEKTELTAQERDALLNRPIMRPYVYADHTDEENERRHNWLRSYPGFEDFPTYAERKRLDALALSGEG